MLKILINALLAATFCLSASIVFSQSQVVETPNGAKLFIEEEPQSQSQQLPESLRLRGTYNNGTTTYFSLNGTKGLEMLPFDQQSSSVQLNAEGFRLFDFNGEEKVTIKFIGGKTRVSTQEVEILGGSDLSEYFNVTSTSSILPGLLVSISGEDGSLSITKEKRDKKVVGVVSGANGIETGLMMGQRGSIADGDTPIALTGRTYVYATSENGEIKPGDFLTSSSTPGYAMKVRSHRRAKGAVIGKALTSLGEESGFVLVLVNLQ